MTLNFPDFSLTSGNPALNDIAVDGTFKHNQPTICRRVLASSDTSSMSLY